MAGTTAKSGVARLFRTDHEVLDEAGFEQLLRQEFPELAAEMDEYHGLIHVELGVLERRANRWIREGQLDELSHAYSVLDHLARHSGQLHPNVLNALHVSFLEGLAFDHPPHGEEAKRQLPPALRAMWEAQMRHNRKIGWL